MTALPGFALWRWPLELLSLALACAPYLTVAQNWGSLPERIPTHFGPSGLPDAWGARWKIWLYPLISVPLYVIFAAKMRLLPWNGAEAADARLVPLLAPAGILCCALVAYTCSMTVKISRGEAMALNRTVLYPLLGLLLGHCVLATYLLKK